jgi:glycosyltransferase involved in cell wall biosynthesis
LKISVVIPALNEARNIGTVLRAMPAEVDEIVVVDGFSVDGTVDAATTARPDVKIVRQGRRGKGNALAAGFEACSGEYVVMLDADGSMDPSEITKFVAALDAGADYAKGTRFAVGGGSEDITPLRRVGNRALNMLTNVLFRTRYSDLCYGYNAFRRQCIDLFDLEPALHTGESRWGDGFEIETILNTRVAKARVRVAEVPSFERNRMHGQSNLRTFRDGTRVLLTILRERFRTTRPVAAKEPEMAA